MHSRVSGGSEERGGLEARIMWVGGPAGARLHAAMPVMMWVGGPAGVNCTQLCRREPAQHLETIFANNACCRHFQQRTNSTVPCHHVQRRPVRTLPQCGPSLMAPTRRSTVCMLKQRPLEAHWCRQQLQQRRQGQLCGRLCGLGPPPE